MKLFVPTRVQQEELLDEHNAPRPDMERSLRDLRRINRYLGGVAIYRRLMKRYAPSAKSVLDLGTGTTDLLDSLRGDLLRIGLDFNLAHLGFERGGSNTRRVAGDATWLPLRDGSVDVVTSAHFFHHFTEEENVAILSEALRVARQVVIVNDTRRHYAPLTTIRLLGALRMVGRITRFDGPASVLRGYTVDEARAVAERCGAARAAVVKAFPYRFAIVLWKR